MGPKVHPKFTRAILLQQLVTPFVARGGDIHEVLRRNGLPVEVLHDPDHLVEASALYPVFEDNDADKSGSLSVEEMITEKLADFAKADINNDGVLDFEEVTKYYHAAQ